MNVIRIFSFLAILLLSVTTVHAVGPYVRQGAVIVDQGTGLIWQQSTADTNHDHQITSDNYPTGDKVEWKDALAYCEGLTLQGESDWRLPNVRELFSITKLIYTYPHPAIDPVFQCTTWYGYFWSSTTCAAEQGSWDEAWTVDFSDGNTGTDRKTYHHHVRCVRGGLPEIKPCNPAIQYLLMRENP